MKPLLTIAIVLLVALQLGGCGGGSDSTSSVYTATIEPGRKAPPFAYPDMDGNTFRLEEERGRVVLLYFWRYRCEQCRQMFSSLKELEQRYSGKPLTIITIDEDTIHSGSIYSVTKFFKQGGYSFRTLRDDGAYIAGLYKVLWTPTIVVVAPDGTIAFMSVGKPMDFTSPQFTALIERLLASATAL